jgi:hypothetical protein
MVRSGDYLIAKLTEVDWLGFGVVSALAGFLFHRWSPDIFEDQPWRITALIVIVMIGIYLPVYSKGFRYLLPCYPLLVAASFGFLTDLARQATESSVRWRKIAVHAVAVGLVALSFLWQPFVNGSLKRTLAGGYTNKNFEVAQQLAAAIAPLGKGALASVNDGDSVALYAAFLSGRQYYGNRYDDPSVDELVASGAKFLVVARIAAIETTLAKDRRVIPFTLVPDAFGAQVWVKVYEFTERPSVNRNPDSDLY